MAEDLYASFSTAATTPAQADPYASVASPVHPSAAQGWQAQVKPIDLGGGKSSVQRSDGGVWFGPDQGNTGKAGWFDGKGNRLGDAPGQPPPQTVGGWLKGQAQGLGDASLVLAEGLAKPGMALSQLADKGAHAVGLISDEQAAANDRKRAMQQKMMDEDKAKVWGGGVVDATGQALATAPLMLVGGEAPAGAPLVAKMVHGGAQAGLVGMGTRALTPETEQGQGLGATLATKASGANQAGALGAGMGAAAPVVGAVVGKAANWAKGIMNPKAAQVIADSEAAGVTLKPSTIQKAIQEAPPEVQQAQAAMDAFSNKLAQDVKNTPFSGLPEIEAAAAAPGGPRKAAAQAILDQINSGGQEAKDLVQTSAGLTSLREKMRLEALANQRAALAQGVTVEPTKTLAVIDSALNEMNGVDASKWPVKDAALQKLQAFRDSLAGTTKEVPTGLLAENGQPLTRTVETPNSFTALGRTRSDIGDDLSGYFKGTNAEVGEKGSHILQGIKNAISDDMSDAAQNSGNAKLAAADLTFRKEYANYANTYKDPAIVSLIQSKDPSKIMEALARSGPEKAQRIFDVLDPKGQAAAAKAVTDEAFANAFNKRTGDFIPGNVSGGITDKLDALGVVMKGENKFMLDGVKNTMQYLAKAEPKQASALGQRITESAVSASDKSGAIVGLAKALKDGGTDLLFNSPAGKRFLFAAAGYPPNSPLMRNLVETQLPKVLGVTAGRMGSSTASAPETPNDLGTPPR